MKQLQLEHKEWVSKKYPNQPPEIPAAGCVEEAGELLHAVLKTKQVHLWGEDARYTLPKLRAELVDAIGDCGIYAISLCNALDRPFEGEWEGREVGDATELELAVKLVVSAANLAAMPRSRVALTEYVARLVTVAKAVGIDAESAIRVTWLTVKER